MKAINSYLSEILQPVKRNVNVQNRASEIQDLKKINSRLKSLVQRRTRELTDAGAANSKFITIIAHDLRSPFSSVIGSLEVLKTNAKGYSKKDIELLAGIALDSANKTLTLLESLLAWSFSQNEGSSFDPVTVKIDLHKLVREEIDRFYDLALQKQTKLSFSVATGLYVHADSQMVKTVLRNLMDNAWKFTKPGGKITIRALESNGCVEIAVKDNGVGISAEAQRNLFEINTPRTGANNEKGVGIGLRLCKEIIRLHGGSFRLESEQGKGSEFVFTLPHHV